MRVSEFRALRLARGEAAVAHAGTACYVRDGRGEFQRAAVRLFGSGVVVKGRRGELRSLVEAGRGAWVVGRRAAVRAVSRGSRSRLRLAVAGAGAVFGTWVTLTSRDCELDGRRSRRALNRWLTYVRGVYGRVGYLWVREFQRRGSIHYHVWLTGAAYDAGALRDAWLRATGESGDGAARRYAVRVVAWAGGAGYAVKEAAKWAQLVPPLVLEADGGLREMWAGRAWATSRGLVELIVHVASVRAGRVVRGWIRAWWRPFRSGGLALFGSTEVALEAVVSGAVAGWGGGSVQLGTAGAGG